MKVLSVNVGLPRTVEWKGRSVTTGIFKEPVDGRVAVCYLNLEGDRQADLSVHGGPDKAVYAYPAEHYAYWRRELPGMELPLGMFGENLTIEGLREDEVNVGDTFRVGTAELVATQPRMPCYKLGIRFGRADMVRRFLASGRSGVYFAVQREGDVGAGDAVHPLGRDPRGVSICAVTRLYVRETDDPELLRRAIAVPALPEGWREHFQEHLGKLEAV